jgi:predicted O-methyltransferase YrrM
MKAIRNYIHKVDPYLDFPHEDYPSDTQGWGSTHPVFETLVQALKPSVIIEVGSWKGGSAISMGNVCKSLGLETEIVCVDTWLGSPGLYTRKNDQHYESLAHVNGYPSLYYTFLSNIVRAGLQELVTPLPLPSALAAEVLTAAGVKSSLIYIDAAHDYESALNDLRKFWPLLDEDGVMLGDDYKWPGVTAAANEFAAEMKRPIFVATPNKYVIPRSGRARFRTTLAMK